MRRADCDVASSAADAIWKAAPHRLSRLLVKVAISEIGVANCALLHRVLEMAERGVRSWTRLEALKIVTDMASSPKCSAAVDLNEIAGSSPKVARMRREVAEMDAETRIAFVEERRGSLFEEVVATRFLATGAASGERARSTLPRRRRFFALCHEREGGVGTVALAERAFALSRGAEALALALFAAGRPESSDRHEDAPTQAHEFIGGVPSYVFDRHTLVGAWALTLAARKDTDVKSWLREGVRWWEWNLDALAYLLARTEGEVVAHWQPSLLSQQIRKIHNDGHAFIRRESLSDGLALMRSKISAITKYRQSAYDMRFAETK